MGGGTKKCRICNTGNAAALLFLCKGIFCHQMTVDWKMIHHYSSAGPNMLIKQKGLIEKCGCGEEWYVKGELFVCSSAPKKLFEIAKMFLGI